MNRQAWPQKNKKTWKIFLNFFKLRVLSSQIERELDERHAAEIVQLLPALGPLFGLGVIGFNIWDYFIDPAHASLTLGIRIALVTIGAIAYMPTRLSWTPLQRCIHIYCTHTGAIILCEFFLRDGFLYGGSGIAACVFAASVITLRIRTLLLILAIPTVLFISLSVISMTRFSFANGLVLYLFAVGLTCIVLLITRSFYQHAFLLEKKLLRLSRHDGLTGACNRNFLAELADREISIAKRQERTLAVLMLDIDHFKLVNDTYGHDIGDKTIKLLVDTCQKNLRSIDHFGRIGGEEFACVLPEADEEEALICAERLRQSIANLCINTPKGSLHFTVSIGVAILHAGHADWYDLLKDADTALYRAKHAGRNRSVLAA